jgi:diguanylate cyclase (GGDEF)-like protein/PAS domain S-box-containing protein
MSRPLRFWLSLGLSIQVVLSVLVVAFVLLWALVPKLKTEASNQHHLLSQAAASQVGNFLGSFDSHLTLLAGDMAAKAPLRTNQLQEMLDTVAQVQVGIEALYVVDPAYRVVAVGLPKASRGRRDNLMGIDFSGRIFAMEARDRGEKVWSNTYLSARGNIVVALAVPFAFSTPAVAPSMGSYVLVGELDLNEVSRFAGSLSEKDKFLTVILDQRGNVVGHPDAERALRQENLKNLVTLTAAHHEAKIQHFRLDGVDYIGCLTPIAETGWTTLAGQPVDLVYGIVRSTLWSLALGSTIALVVTILAALWASRRIAQGVERVSGRIGAIANGYYNTRIPPSSIEEIENLSRDITGMAEAVLEREARLRENEARFRTLVENVPQGIALISQDEQFLVINPAFTRMFGYALQDVPTVEAWWQRTCPDGLVRIKKIQKWQEQVAAASEAKVTTRTYQLCRADGVLRTFEIVAERLPDGSTLLTFVDITEKRLEEARRQRAANVFSHSHEGIMILDPDGNIVEVNSAFSRITGYRDSEIRGKSHLILRSDLQDDEFYRNMWQTLMQRGNWCGELWNRTRGGQLYAALTDITAVNDSEGAVQNYVVLFSDITQMKEYQRQLERAAHYDALTGLPNRVLLADRLRKGMIACLERNVSLAVLYLDLDSFKQINDLHGHTIGDQLLLILAQRMKDVLRDGDTLSRIGGDEFVAVLNGLEHEIDCFPIIERLLHTAAQPFLLADLELTITVSIGVTFYPRDNGEADLLMRHADQAMYQAKQQGKNQFAIFDIVQGEATIRLQQLVTSLRKAIIQNELVLYFQPKVNLRTKELIGAEALVRWQHPELGLLPPSEFLPPIAEHPISVALGEWVIDHALEQISAWAGHGLDLPVSVNIGAHQLLSGAFKIRLTELLAKHPDVSPDHLELEILETSALQDLDQVSTLMYDCVNLGVGFSLDDFGTGYSSLTYLKRLPAAVIKIDQSFVRGMLEDPNDFAIVVGVVGLAKAFYRQVIAEGVETAEHGESLLKLGCTLAQGYGIARPMSAHDFLDWARLWNGTHRNPRSPYHG